MKFTALKENLERATSIAERFSGKNVTLPILGHILFEFQGNTLVVSATNLEYAVKVSLSGAGTGSGRIAVPAKVINSLVQSLKPGERVTLLGKQDSLLVSADNRSAKINGLPPDDFPIIPQVKRIGSFQVDSHDLLRGLEKVVRSASASEFKPELAGVLFRASGATLKLASTDTFRLAECVLELGKNQKKEDTTFILPQRVAQEISRIVPGDGDGVEIGLGDNQAVFETNGVEITSRLVDGNFPDYTGIVPQDFLTSCFVKREELAQAVRSSSIFSSKIQDVTLSIQGKEMKISSSNQELGENETNFPVSKTGKDTKISFNHRYLMDGLTSLDEEEIFLGLNDDQKPSLLRNKSEGNFFYVLMPIRLT